MFDLTPDTKTRILISSEETTLPRTLSLMLGKAGFEVIAAGNSSLARRKLSETRVDIVIADLLPSDGNSLNLIRLIKRSYPDIESILLTSGDDSTRAVEAMQAGAGDIITKPFTDEEFLLRVTRAMERQLMKRELMSLRQRVAMNFGFDNIVGISKQIDQARETARRVAPTEITVLISGASGTGKELFARTIHHHSERRHRPFVAVDCSAIPENQIEAELFGHINSPARPDTAREQGLIEQADGGTLFLDEVDRLTADLQAKLLRFLQDSGIRPNDSEPVNRLNVRTVAATSRNLAMMVTEGKFREDLYYRLNIIPLQLPTLRERSEDIEVLTDYFLRRIATELNKPALGINREAVDKLLRHTWPGNIRELENTLKRAAALCGRDQLEASDITFVAGSDTSHIPATPTRTSLTIKGNLLEGNQRSLIIGALNDNNWNYTKTAAELGIGRTTLWRKIRKYELRRELVSD